MTTLRQQFEEALDGITKDAGLRWEDTEEESGKYLNENVQKLWGLVAAHNRSAVLKITPDSPEAIEFAIHIGEECQMSPNLQGLLSILQRMLSSDAALQAAANAIVLEASREPVTIN